MTSIAKNIYGADKIELSEYAQKQVETYTKQGYSHLPSESRHSLNLGHQLDRSPSLHG